MRRIFALALVLPCALACVPHRAQRAPVLAGAAAAEPDPEAVVLAPPPPDWAEPERAPQPWKPRRITRKELSALAVSTPRVMVSWRSTYEHAGTRQLIGFELCIGTDGSVDPLRTAQLDGPADLGQRVRAQILEWKFKRSKEPLCASSPSSSNRMVTPRR